MAIELHLGHRDYASDEIGWGELQRQQSVTLKSLRDLNVKVMLSRK